MAHLIDKDALVTEIERRIKSQQTCMKIGYRLTGKAEEEIILEYKQFLSFLDTLEVKEVDLDKEYKDFVEDDMVYNKLVNGIVGKAIAKHFFELGLKVHKGE